MPCLWKPGLAPGPALYLLVGVADISQVSQVSPAQSWPGVYLTTPSYNVIRPLRQSLFINNLGLRRGNKNRNVGNSHDLRQNIVLFGLWKEREREREREKETWVRCLSQITFLSPSSED